MGESYHYKPRRKRSSDIFEDLPEGAEKYIGKPEGKPKGNKKRDYNTKRNLLLVALGLGYAIYERDIPLFIAAVAVLLFFLQPAADKYLGRFGGIVSGFLRGVGAALFLGAIALLFF